MLARKELVPCNFLAVLDFSDVLQASIATLRALGSVYHAAPRVHHKCLTHPCGIYIKIGWSSLTLYFHQHWFRRPSRVKCLIICVLFTSGQLISINYNPILICLEKLDKNRPWEQSVLGSMVLAFSPKHFKTRWKNVMF